MEIALLVLILNVRNAQQITIHALNVKIIMESWEVDVNSVQFQTV
jgi:hypothetical protein